MMEILFLQTVKLQNFMLSDADDNTAQLCNYRFKSLTFLPHFAISIIKGNEDLPSFVRLYSTFGGTTEYTFLSMIPAISSSLAVWVNILLDIPPILLIISDERNAPCANDKSL